MAIRRGATAPGSDVSIDQWVSRTAGRLPHTKGKEAVEVLHGLDLAVEAGDFVALMGPSGSGKTTLLNLIGGLDHPTAGGIKVAGQSLEALSNNALAGWRAREIGFIFPIIYLV